MWWPSCECFSEIRNLSAILKLFIYSIEIWYLCQLVAIRTQVGLFCANFKSSILRCLFQNYVLYFRCILYHFTFGWSVRLGQVWHLKIIGTIIHSKTNGKYLMRSGISYKLEELKFSGKINHSKLYGNFCRDLASLNQKNYTQVWYLFENYS